MEKEKLYTVSSELNDPEITTDGDRCEQCKFYIIHDSAVGSCRRFPPKTEEKESGFWFRLLGPSRLDRGVQYPRTYWCKKACGEYLLKGQRK